MQPVLFDIDGTLLTRDKAGTGAMRQACAELYCMPDGFAEIPFAGKKKPLILQQALAQHGLPETEEAHATFYACYRHHLLRRTPQEPGVYDIGPEPSGRQRPLRPLLDLARTHLMHSA